MILDDRNRCNNVRGQINVIQLLGKGDDCMGFQILALASACCAQILCCIACGSPLGVLVRSEAALRYPAGGSGNWHVRGTRELAILPPWQWSGAMCAHELLDRFREFRLLHRLFAGGCLRSGGEP